MKRSLGNIFALSCLMALLVLGLALNGCGSSGSSDSGYWGGIGDNTGTVSPTVTSCTNEAGVGTVTPGQTCVINGSGFGGDRSARENGQSYVLFVSQNGTPVTATTYTFWSDTLIRCIVPPLAANTSYVVQVTVMDSTGTYSSSLIPSSGNTVTVSSSFAIASITPTMVNLGRAITINGTGFGNSQGTGFVQFGLQIGGIAQHTVGLWSDNQIVCLVPTEVSPGPVPVSVIKGTVEASNSVTITVVSATAPLISGINPSSIAVGATPALTITGTNFGNAIGTGNVTFQVGTSAPMTVTTGITWAPELLSLLMPAGMTTTANTVHVTVQTSTGEFTNSYNITVGSTTAKVYALFVGINDYIDPSINDLSWCVNDVDGMKIALTECGLWNNAQVVTLTNAQATKVAISNTISSYVAQVTAQDTFFFYYSGHGSNSGGHSYIIPADSQLTADSNISDVELEGWLTPMNATAKKCIIFDSCNSGGFVGKKPGERARFTRMIDADPFYRGDFFSKQLTSLPNMVFLAAAKGSQTSLETEALQHGIFTNFCIEGLGSGLNIGPAAAVGGTSITAQQTFVYAAPRAIDYSGPGHEPVMQDNYPGGLTIKQ
jgi:hypothetical protein